MREKSFFTYLSIGEESLQSLATQMGLQIYTPSSEKREISLDTKRKSNQKPNQNSNRSH